MTGSQTFALPMSLGLDPERRVGARRQVGVPDHRRELDEGGRSELLEETGRHLVGDRGRRLAHRLCILHDVALERCEHRRLTPPRDLTRLGHVEARVVRLEVAVVRSEEHTSELQSLMRISYAVFCLKKKQNT